MRSDFENEIWEAFLKDAVIEHSLKELEEYETDKIQQTPLPLHYVLYEKVHASLSASHSYENYYENIQKSGISSFNTYGNKFYHIITIQ